MTFLDIDTVINHLQIDVDFTGFSKEPCLFRLTWRLEICGIEPTSLTLGETIPLQNQTLKRLQTYKQLSNLIFLYVIKLDLPPLSQNMFQNPGSNYFVFQRRSPQLFVRSATWTPESTCYIFYSPPSILTADPRRQALFDFLEAGSLCGDASSYWTFPGFPGFPGMFLEQSA